MDSSKATDTKLLILLLLLTVIVASVSAQRVGVYPGRQNLGEVNRGEQVSIDLLLAGGEEGEKVRITHLPLRQKAFRNEYQDIDFVPENASEQDVEGWISFMEDDIELGPSREFEVGGTTVTANHRTSYILKVPEEAEPGYHMASMMPNIVSQEESQEGLGVNFEALSAHNLIFKVPGKAVRDAEVLGFNSERTSEDSAVIKLVVQNTGTVTETISIETRVQNRNNTYNLRHKGGKLTPGEIEIFEASWSPENLTEGTYNVSADVSWLTDSKTSKGEVRVTSYQEEVVRETSDKDGNTFVILLSLVSVALGIAAVKIAYDTLIAKKPA